MSKSKLLVFSCEGLFDFGSINLQIYLEIRSYFSLVMACVSNMNNNREESLNNLWLSFDIHNLVVLLVLNCFHWMLGMNQLNNTAGSKCAPT